MSTHKASQVNAINDAIGEMNGVERIALEGQESLKELPDILEENELPERIILGRTHGDKREGMLVATDRRFIFVEVKTGLFSKTVRVKVKDFPYDKITSVEYSPGIVMSNITIYLYGKKEVFERSTLFSTFQARTFAEHLQAKVQAHTTASPPVAATYTTAKEDAINDAIRLGGSKGKSNAKFLRQLQDILGCDEIPERIILSGIGSLIATNRRLIYVHGMFSLKVEEFRYGKISSVQSTTSRPPHKITIHVHGNKEAFDVASQDQADGFAEHLRGKIHTHTQPSVPDTYKAAKAHAIDDAIRQLDNFDFLPLDRDEIKQLPDILGEEELPERIVVGRYNYRNGVLVDTDRRLIFVDKGMFSLKVDDFPYDMISSVELLTGVTSGKITIQMYGKKEIFDGVNKDQTSGFAEHLREKVHAHTSTLNTSPPIPDKVSVASSYKTAKAYAIEDAIRGLNDLDGAERNLLVRGELKRLPDILGKDELPEMIMPGNYDDREGLQVSRMANLRQGLLVATDRRLIFVDKEMGSLKVDDFPYDEISYVESSTGTLSGEITVHVSGNKEVFGGDTWRVQRLTRHLQDKISAHAAVPAESKSDVINDAILKLGGTKELLDMSGIKQLPDILGDTELPEKMTFAEYDGWVGMLFATASRLIFAPTVGKPPSKVESFPYDTIAFVESSTGMLFGKITIYSSGNKETFDQVDNGAIREFEEYMQAKIPAPAPTPPIPGQVSVADELKKLLGLVDRGILTQEEFEVQKKKLLQI